MNGFFSKTVRKVFLLSFLHISIYLMVYPKMCAAAAQSAAVLCAKTVIPSLFPFLICSGYLAASGAMSLCSRYLSPVMRPLFKVPGCGAAAFILGLVSGYPVGAACSADLYTRGECTKAEAERLCVFCNNSGPLFVISVVGGFLGSERLGVYLYISHILAALATGIIFRFYKASESSNGIKALPMSVSVSTKNSVRIFGEVMDSSVFTMLKICGFIIFFSVFAASLPQNSVSPFLHGILEITGGIKKISMLSLALDKRMCIISFFLAFSGISVMMQVGAITSSKGISLAPFFAGKIIHGIISVFFTFILTRLFPITESAFKITKGSAAFAAEPLEYLLYSGIAAIAAAAFLLLITFMAARLRRN